MKVQVRYAITKIAPERIIQKPDITDELYELLRKYAPQTLVWHEIEVDDDFKNQEYPTYKISEPVKIDPCIKLSASECAEIIMVANYEKKEYSFMATWVSVDLNTSRAPGMLQLSFNKRGIHMSQYARKTIEALTKYYTGGTN